MTLCETTTNTTLSEYPGNASSGHSSRVPRLGYQMCQDRNAGKWASLDAIHLRWQHNPWDVRKDGPHGRRNERNNQPEREVYFERYSLSHYQVQARWRIRSQHATYCYYQCRQCP